MDPYFKTKENHQSVYPNHYNLVSAVYELCYNKEMSFKTKETLQDL